MGYDTGHKDFLSALAIGQRMPYFVDVQTFFCTCTEKGSGSGRNP